MNYDDVIAMMGKMEIPFAYDHFAEGESPDPPFMVFLFPSSDNFSADGKVYQKISNIHVELYTDKKQPDIEAKVEGVLDSYGFFYDKTEVWIPEERLYEVLYSMEVLWTDDTSIASLPVEVVDDVLIFQNDASLSVDDDILSF